MKLKELMKALQDKSPFRAVWAFMWRIWVIGAGIYAVLALFGLMIM